MLLNVYDKLYQKKRQERELLESINVPQLAHSRLCQDSTMYVIETDDSIDICKYFTINGTSKYTNVNIESLKNDIRKEVMNMANGLDIDINEVELQEFNTENKHLLNNNSELNTAHAIILGSVITHIEFNNNGFYAELYPFLNILYANHYGTKANTLIKLITDSFTKISGKDFMDKINIFLTNDSSSIEAKKILYKQQTKEDIKQPFMKTYTSNDDESSNYLNIDTNYELNQKSLITIAKSKSKDTPYQIQIYPKDLVSIGTTLKIDNNTHMLLDNINSLKTRFNDGDNTTLNVPSIKDKTDNKITTIIKNNVDNAIKTVDLYENVFKQICINRDYTSNYTDSSGLQKHSSIYLPEILSPYVICDNGCSWNSDGETNGYKTMCNVLGIKNNYTNLRDIAYVGYNTNATEALSDAYIYFKIDEQNNLFKKLSISVKGGLNGVGASASIQTLRQYVFNNDDKLTILGVKLESTNKIYKTFNKIFEIITRDHTKITSNDLKYLTNTLGISIQINKDSSESKILTIKEVCKKLSHNADFQQYILKILQSLSYDFIQLNAKPSEANEDFHFNFTAQYPAIFKGRIHIEYTGIGNIKFHII